jgi:hypothetical protein
LKIQVELVYRHREPRHIPHPTTYLNGERWNDELQSEKPVEKQATGNGSFSSWYTKDEANKNQAGRTFDVSGNQLN